MYNNLKNINNITLLENLENRKTAAWLFTLKVKNKSDFIDKMKLYNIMTSQVHNRNDINTCVSEFKCELPNITELEKELINNTDYLSVLCNVDSETARELSANDYISNNKKRNNIIENFISNKNTIVFE